MKISEIYKFLDDSAPFATAEQWDNSGFLIGDINKDIKRCVVCLDVTKKVVEYCISINAELIISHHPVIFKGLKSITADDIQYKIIRSGLSVICAHTNLDKSKDGVNDTLCEALELPFEKVSGEVANGFLNLITLDKCISSSEFADIIKSKLDADIRYCDAGKFLNRVAVCSGAGSDFIEDAVLLGCDAYLTGEASYHTFLDAKDRGISLFAAGHYETEIPVVAKLTELLKNTFTTVEFYEAPYEKTVLSVK